MPRLIGLPPVRYPNLMPTVVVEKNDPRLKVEDNRTDESVRFDQIPMGSDPYMWKGKVVFKISPTQVALVQRPNVKYDIGQKESLKPFESRD